MPATRLRAQLASASVDRVQPPGAGLSEIAPDKDLTKRLRIEVRGVVQGVGFRPFVYRLATELGLTGWVINDTRGVFIEVEGDRARQESFLQRVESERPARSTIHSIDASWLEPAG